MSLPIMNSFTFDGRCSLDWGIGLSGSGVWDAPMRKGELIEIPGRNGAVWQDEGVFENISVTYPCWMARGFLHRIDDFRAYLMAHSDGYYRLEDTYHPDEFRKARYPGPFTATPGAANYTGRFDIVFDCDPRRFLKSGEQPHLINQVGGSEVWNPTYYESYPLIQIDNDGPCTIAFNSKIIEVVENVGSGNTLLFDCDTMIATVNGAIVYGLVVADERPTMSPGRNSIDISGTVSTDGADYIYPRWWTI